MTTMDLNDEQRVSVKTAAKIADKHPRTIRRWIKLGKLKARQPGAVKKHRRGGAPYRIRVADLRAALDADLTAYEAPEKDKDPSP